MKNLIYQCYDGEISSQVKASVNNIRAYSSRIGAKHLFEENVHFPPGLSPHQQKYYGILKVAYDPKFEEYDDILCLDCDIFAVEGLRESPFPQEGGFKNDLGICTEPFQIVYRTTLTRGNITGAWDEKWDRAIYDRWGICMPRTKEGLFKVYNTGVLLFSRTGRKKIRERFTPIKEYISYIQSKKFPTFYTLDQPYIHANMMIHHLNVEELDNGWNSYVHFLGDPHLGLKRPVNDTRDTNTKFVHVQLSGTDHLDSHTMWRIVNQPVNLWNL